MKKELDAPLRLVGLIRTCSANPTQWEALTEDDARFVYIRYRWGCLSVGVGSSETEAVENAGGRGTADPWYSEEVGEELDGTIEWEEVARLANLVALT